MNEIQWSRKALKQLRKLAPQDGKVVFAGAGELSRFPECKNVKQLRNHQYGFRLRVGRHRVLFDYDGDVKIISIEEVKKRDENTY
ncbi:MAG: type II toxin-antitoxin system RelE/ParE family toxin [Pseudohongiella sp.]|uniref:type II toxin-antitoxin system RelE/ParE family toxin n=1 Tax=Pseudohongiella sp. TaxID=1979412 RepID=UPI0034A0393B